MKLNELRKVIREEVKAAIQEELKDILLEAVRSPKTVVTENNPVQSQPQSLPETDKAKLRENMMNVLGGMMPGANGTLSATSADVPLQMSGPVDTTSPNGTLPQGNVSMDQIMGLMNSKG